MTRYQVLRGMGMDVVSAGLIAAANWAMGAPRGYVGFMNVEVEYDPEEVYDPKEHYELTPRDKLI